MDNQATSQINEQEFLAGIVMELVEFPDAVSVSRRVDDMGVLLELSMDPSDMGKIIGREGHTANAIRTVLKAFGKKHQANISMKIKEPEAKGSIMEYN